MGPHENYRWKFKSKRKDVSEIWQGEAIDGVTNIVGFAPSACNTQPWYVEQSGTSLLVYRYKKPGKRGIMPTAAVSYYNRIDIGIFMYFMDVCLCYNDIKFEKHIYVDDGEDREKTLTAEYTIFGKDGTIE